MKIYLFHIIFALLAQEINLIIYNVLTFLSEVRELQPIPLSPNLSQIDLEIFLCDNLKQLEKYFIEMENNYSQLN